MSEKCRKCLAGWLIWVHGHWQCDACGQVVEACCSGETAQSVDK